LDSDLVFLTDALRRETTVAEVAGFLGRTSDEVQAKAAELNVRLPTEQQRPKLTSTTKRHP
jgi:hypothetical protein